jgi:hypothetical protein
VKLLAIMCAVLISSCCTYISKQDAIQIANGEIKRRNIRLPRQYTVDAERSTIIAESGPDIPVYVVSFNIAKAGKQVPYCDV